MEEGIYSRGGGGESFQGFASILDAQELNPPETRRRSGHRRHRLAKGKNALTSNLSPERERETGSRELRTQRERQDGGREGERQLC